MSRCGQMKRVTLFRSLAILATPAVFTLALGPLSPAGAQTFSSSYTSTAEKDCRTVGKPQGWRRDSVLAPANRGWWW